MTERLVMVGSNKTKWVPVPRFLLDFKSYLGLSQDF